MEPMGKHDGGRIGPLGSNALVSRGPGFGGSRGW